MRLLMRWAARLYPASWRARYGDELGVLMEDTAPRWTDITDLLRGALTMQLTSLNFWKIALGCTLAGALAAGVWSLTLQDRYVSTAVLRLGDSGNGALEVRPRMMALQQRVFSRGSLATIIARQNLYAKERTSLPLEDIIQNMRDRDIRTTPLHDTRFTVSVANPDPAAAQAALRAVVATMIEANIKQDGASVGTLEVIEPASLPAAPTGPGRVRLIRNGLLAGLMLGVVTGALWTMVRGRRQWSLLRIGAFAAGGMALGMTIAMLTPDQFVSTAVLRTTERGKLPAALQAAFTNASIEDLIRKYSLYPSERQSTAVGKMRNAIRVQPVQTPALGGTAAQAFTVSFVYADGYKAQAVTRELISRISGSLPAEVLDPATMPQAPSSPNRPQMAAFGLFAGMLLGLATARFQRAPLATA